MLKFKYVGQRNPKDEFDLTINVESVIEERTNMFRIYKTPLIQVVRHSPTGMEWGYGGSGPADTALSILVDYLLRTCVCGNKKKATKMVDGIYMYFKDKYIAAAEREGFEITDTQVYNFLKGKEVI